VSTVNEQTKEGHRRSALPDLGRLLGAVVLGICVLVAELQYLSWSRDHRIAEVSALLEYRAEAARDALLRAVDDATEELESWEGQESTELLLAGSAATTELPESEAIWAELARSLPSGWSLVATVSDDRPIQYPNTQAESERQVRAFGVEALGSTVKDGPLRRIEAAGPGGREAMLLSAFAVNQGSGEDANRVGLVLRMPLHHTLKRLSEEPLPGALGLEPLTSEAEEDDDSTQLGSSYMLPELGVRLSTGMSRDEAMEPVRQTRLALFALDMVLAVALVLMVLARSGADEGGASTRVQRSAAGLVVLTVSIACALGLWRFSANVVDEYESERFDDIVGRVRQEFDQRLSVAMANPSQVSAAARGESKPSTHRGALFTSLLIEYPSSGENGGNIRVITPPGGPEAVRPIALWEAAQMSTPTAPVLTPASWRGSDGEEHEGLATLVPATGSSWMWSAAFYRLEDFLAPPSWMRQGNVGYRVFSGPPSKATLIYEHGLRGEGGEPIFLRSTLLAAGGETWLLLFEAAPSFVRPMGRIFPPLLLVGVSALGTLLAIFAFSGLAAGERLWKRARSVEKRSKLTAARSRSVLESISGAVIEFREDGRIETWSKGAEQLFGRAASEMIGQSIREALPRLTWEEIGDQAPQEALQPSIHTEGKRPDGTGTAVAVAVGSALAGRRRYYTACVSEILEPPLLDASFDHTRNLPEDWVWDIEADRLHLSAAARSLLGLISNQDEFAPNAWFDRLPPVEHDESLQALSKQLNSRAKGFMWEHDVRLADDSSRRVEVFGLIERAEGGQARRLHGKVRLLRGVTPSVALSASTGS